MRPMKAGPFVPEHVRYSVIVQPKWDGWRGIVQGGALVTATLKPIPNRFVQNYFMSKDFSTQGLDGELTMGDPTAPDCFNKVDTFLKRHDGEPDFTFRVFDVQTSTDMTFADRYSCACEIVADLSDPRVVMTPNHWAHSYEELMAEEERLVLLGYEGAILRSPDGVYKPKRSTSREGYCIKLKRFEDSDATLIGFEELYSNQNTATLDARGLTHRQSLQENLVPMNTLGAFLVRDLYTNEEFRIGSFKGLDMQARKEIWEMKHRYLGKTLVYKYQKVGGYTKPRIPIFKGWRSDLL